MVAGAPQATPTLSLWQRSPVAQSPSPAQYFRHIGPPPVGMLMHAAPFAHCMVVVEQAAPIAAVPLSGRQATTAASP